MPFCGCAAVLFASLQCLLLFCLLFRSLRFVQSRRMRAHTHTHTYLTYCIFVSYCSTAIVSFSNVPLKSLFIHWRSFRVHVDNFLCYYRLILRNNSRPQNYSLYIHLCQDTHLYISISATIFHTTDNFSRDFWQ